MLLVEDAIKQVLVIAYRENTSQLEAQFIEQGFDCHVLRQHHQSEHKDYSPSYLCLLNHCSAWKQVVESNQPQLICEADFVPVRSLNSLPMPYDTNLRNVGIAWLYTCAPQIYSVSSRNHAIGFSTSMVAYILTPAGAQVLLELAGKIAESPGPTQYSTWDSKIEESLRVRKLDGYLPWRNYGEHGGKPNSEHKKAGLSSVHRADLLYGKLAFTPIYAEPMRYSSLSFFSARTKARIKGIGRLLLGKYLRPLVLTGSSTPLRMLKFAVGRHFYVKPLGFAQTPFAEQAARGADIERGQATHA